MTGRIKCLVLIGFSISYILPACGEKMYFHSRTKEPVDFVMLAIDEWGKPLANEAVTISPYREDSLFAKWKILKGQTDSNGCFRAKGYIGGPECFCHYRPGDIEYYCTSLAVNTPDVARGVVITGVVRKVGNPVPMGYPTIYVRGEREFAEFGIDMVKGELMPPDGKGLVTDAVLRVSTEFRKDPINARKRPVKSQASFELMDPGSGFLVADSFPSCSFSTLREAPMDGNYVPVQDSSVTFDPHEDKDFMMWNLDRQHCVFRIVRKSVDEGRKKCCYYGLVRWMHFNPSWVEEQGFEWNFEMRLVSNGRPDDRNLEMFGCQRDAWRAAKYEEFLETPIPEALK